MTVCTKRELGKALGCVVYDMLMLLCALSVHRRRLQYPFYEELTWGEPQIAKEVILLKSRSLLDFISPGPRTRGDIVITDFGRPHVALPQNLQNLRRSVNKWSAHLSWQRVLRLPRDASQPTASEMEQHAQLLLSWLDIAVRDCMAAGVVLTEEHHQRYYRVFQREYAKMTEVAGLPET